MKTRRLFNYPGTKRFLAEKVNALLKKWAKDEYTWIEPFCGSAGLFYNLDPAPAKAYLNDIDRNLVLMHQACRDYDYQTYLKVVEAVDRKFGDVRTDKDAYYTYREWYNTEGRGSSMAGLYLLYLSSMCINSMLRFGPRGMNQGWGRRKYVLDEETWNDLHARLEHVQTTSKDYRAVQLVDSSVVFLDPPYESADNVLYGNGFSQDQFLSWLRLSKAKQKHCLWLYTDVETEKSDSLLQQGFKKTVLRDMVTIAPSREKHSTVSRREVLYIGLS